MNDDRTYLEISDEEIGSGGYARVFFVPTINRARKQLHMQYRNDANIRKRFKKEYEILKSLEDVPGIMKVYSFDEENNSYLMQLCDRTLDDYVNSEKCFDEEKINIIYQILETMSVVHSRNIIHRDLSPTNIFTYNEEVIIGDFGLGRAIDSDYSRITIMTNQVGQYLYTAPEQLESLKNSTIQSDVYSLGKVINFVMTGSCRESNHRYYGIVSKATSEKSFNRYSDALEMFNDFKRINDNNYKKELKDQVKGLLNIAEYSDKTDEYILTLSQQELSDFLAENRNADYAILNLLKNRPHITNDIIDNLHLGIRSGYEWYQ